MRTLPIALALAFVVSCAVAPHPQVHECCTVIRNARGPIDDATLRRLHEVIWNSPAAFEAFIAEAKGFAADTAWFVATWDDGGADWLKGLQCHLGEAFSLRLVGLLNSSADPAYRYMVAQSLLHHSHHAHARRAAERPFQASVAEAILKVLARERAVDVRSTLLDAASAYSYPEVADTAVALVLDGRESERMHNVALRALSFSPPEYCSKLTAHSDPSVRGMALNRLIECEDARGWPLLRREADPAVIVRALKDVAFIPAASVRTLLMECRTLADRFREASVHTVIAERLTYTANFCGEALSRRDPALFQEIRTFLRELHRVGLIEYAAWPKLYLLPYLQALAPEDLRAFFEKQSNARLRVHALQAMGDALSIDDLKNVMQDDKDDVVRGAALEEFMDRLRSLALQGQLSVPECIQEGAAIIDLIYASRSRELTRIAAAKIRPYERQLHLYLDAARVEKAKAILKSAGRP